MKNQSVNFSRQAQNKLHGIYQTHHVACITHRAYYFFTKSNNDGCFDPQHINKGLQSRPYLGKIIKPQRPSKDKDQQTQPCLICMLLHVVESIFISIHQKKDVAMETHFGSNEQVLSCVVFRRLTCIKLLPRLFNATSFQEFPTNNSYNEKTVSTLDLSNGSYKIQIKIKQDSYISLTHIEFSIEKFK